MANPFFAALMNGNIRMPDASINHMGPLPTIPSGSPQFSTADGQYNQHGLPNLGLSPYAYGQAARISTQTQMAHPHRVALIIPKLYLPSPQADIANASDPVLEHAISDGDLVFSFRMSPDMTCYGSKYFNAPYGYSAKAVPLINLATVNYILWGLQVGLQMDRHTHWALIFGKLLHNHPLLYNSERLTMEHIWNFIKTYLRPFAIQHGGDMQGGRHEGDTDPIITHGAVDYVSSFAIEGKLLHVNNLWRDFDVHEGDDLVLTLEKMEAPHSDVFFNLSSSSRTNRTEQCQIGNPWYYLRPSVLEFKTFVDTPYIHIGRSQKYCSLYSRGKDICCWDARMCVVPGAPLQMTFVPGFVQSDDMYYDELELNEAEYNEDDTTGTDEQANAARDMQDNRLNLHMKNQHGDTGLMRAAQFRMDIKRRPDAPIPARFAVPSDPSVPILPLPPVPTHHLTFSKKRVAVQAADLSAAGLESILEDDAAAEATMADGGEAASKQQQPGKSKKTKTATTKPAASVSFDLSPPII